MALLDRVIFLPTNDGAVDFTVQSAVDGYQTPAAAKATDGAQFSYAAEFRTPAGKITEWEVGQGTWTAATNTLSRTTVLFSSNNNAKVNFSRPPQVMITALGEDFAFLPLSANTTFTVSIISGTITAGTGGAGGTYGTVAAPIALTGGSGTGALAIIQVSGGGVVSVMPLSPANGGSVTGYKVGDVLSAASGSIGNTVGFSFTITAIGNNANPGTAALPFLTTQQAITTISSTYNFQHHNCTLAHADGVYDGIFVQTTPVNCKKFLIVGNLTDVSRVIWTDAFGAGCATLQTQQFVTLILSQITFQPQIGGNDCLNINQYGCMRDDGVDNPSCQLVFDGTVAAMAHACICNDTCEQFIFNASVTVKGTWDVFASVGFGPTCAIFFEGGSTLTFSGNPTFNTALFEVGRYNTIAFNAAQVGSFTGKIYTINPGFLELDATITGTAGTLSGGFTFIGSKTHGSADVYETIPGTFSALPSSPSQGMVATITDGLAGNCADGSCTTFGTNVTGGTGALKLLLWYNGSHWTLMGK